VAGSAAGLALTATAARVIVGVPRLTDSRMKWTLACLVALLPAAFSCAAQVPMPDDGAMDADEAAELQAAQAATGAWYARVADALAASGKPRDLAFAATLLQMAGQAGMAGAAPGGDAPSQAVPADPRTGKWRQLASARAGSDVVANALLLQGDAPADAAVRTQALARWRKLEPDNLAPDLYAGTAADWLPQAGRYARLDQHYYEQLRWMQAVLAAHLQTEAERAVLGGDQLPADDAAAVAAAAILAAVAAPALQPLIDACRGDALDAAPTRRADCRHVARVAADTADTSIGTSIGVALMQATAATPGEQADARERRRRLDWQMLEWGRIAGSQPDGGAAQFVRLLQDPAVRSERDLVERVLAEARVPAEPPAGWQAPRR